MADSALHAMQMRIIKFYEEDRRAQAGTPPDFGAPLTYRCDYLPYRDLIFHSFVVKKYVR